MIDFQKELAYALFTTHRHRISQAHQYHRRNKYYLNLDDLSSKCSSQIKLKFDDIYTKYPLSFNMICKKCLSTFTKQEIKDFKFWLIVRKLKN